MTSRRIEDTTRRQHKLFDLAHKNALEIKPLGLRFRQEGIDPRRQYCNPSLPPLPFGTCDVLASLDEAQRNVLSAMFFGALYRSLADAERRVTRMNMQAADRCFRRWSDQYFVLHQETNEEYDHIHCFASITRTLYGSAEVIDGEPFVFCCDETIRPFSTQLDDAGWGAFYLLHRFIANIALKGIEGFLFYGVDERDADPLAWEINHAHLTDEARHVTTSLELGLGLYEQANAASRDVIRRAMRAIAWLSTEHFFSEGGHANAQGYALAHMALRQAFTHPAFSDVRPDADTLIARWKDWEYPESEGFLAGRRWYARELKRLVDAMEISLPTYSASIEQLKAVWA